MHETQLLRGANDEDFVLFSSTFQDKVDLLRLNSSVTELAALYKTFSAKCSRTHTFLLSDVICVLKKYQFSPTAKASMTKLKENP